MVHAGLEALDAQQSRTDFPLVCVCATVANMGLRMHQAAAAVVRPHVMSFDNVVLFVQATFEHALASGRCGIARTRKLPGQPLLS